MDKLRSCPFCGGDPVLEHYKARKGYEATIFCNGGCNAYMTTITFDTEEEAIENVVKAWNRRVPCETCNEDKRIAIKIGTIMQSNEDG